jgi:homoserine dehydrogenase
VTGPRPRPLVRRLLLVGLGNVGRSFLHILQTQESLLAERYGVAFRVVGAADSGGIAAAPGGLDPAVVLAAKGQGRSVATLAAGRPAVPALELVKGAAADALLEATPVDLATGQPGLDITRAALRRGLPVVLANKGPLALAYQELAALSDLGAGGTPLRFSACVGGALPTINLGLRDLAGARILRVEAVLNGTTQYILRAMEAGQGYAEVLADAQRRGLAETDPSLDVDGWDAAGKLVILANAVLRQPASLADVRVEGIGGLTAEDLRAARARGERIVLLCLAQSNGAGRFRLSVRPAPLPLEHPLARMGGDEMGVVYYTDIAGRSSAASAERDPVPTAAAMLRDLLELAGALPARAASRPDCRTLQGPAGTKA